MAGVQCSFERVEKKFVLTHAQAERILFSSGIIALAILR